MDDLEIRRARNLSIRLWCVFCASTVLIVGVDFVTIPLLVDSHDDALGVLAILIGIVSGIAILWGLFALVSFLNRNLNQKKD